MSTLVEEANANVSSSTTQYELSDRPVLSSISISKATEPIDIETNETTDQIIERLQKTHCSPKSPSSLSNHSIKSDEMALAREDLNKVHEELEKLNIATDVINKLELQLDEARTKFRDIQSSWSQRLDQLRKKLGKCIDQSRPYYEVRLEARRVHEMSHQACIRFERANSLHQVAKQQVALTQESLNRQQGKGVDPACLEVLNHHIQRWSELRPDILVVSSKKPSRRHFLGFLLLPIGLFNFLYGSCVYIILVNEAEAERIASEEAHRRVSIAVADINARVQHLEKELGRSIKKSRTYFEARVEFTRVLEQQKLLIGRLEQEVKQKKADYTQSLRNLELISERIHEERQASHGLTPCHSARGSERKSHHQQQPAASTGNTGESSSTDDVSMAPSSVPEDPTVDTPAAEHPPQQQVVITETAPDDNEVPVSDEQRREDDNRLTEDRISRLVVEDKDSQQSLTRNARSEPRSLIDKFLNRRSHEHSGVILLPNDLSGTQQSTDNAYRLPNNSNVEHLDLSYRTVPEGVKAELTPPSTSRSFSHMSGANTSGSTVGYDSDDAISIASSIGPVATDDDEKIAGMMQSHTQLIQEISDSAKRAAENLSITGRVRGHARSISDALRMKIE